MGQAHNKQANDKQANDEETVFSKHVSVGKSETRSFH